MTFDLWISGHARFQPAKIAIRQGERQYTYRDLARLIEQTAFLLQGPLQLKHGDRICYLGLNHAEIVVLVFAAARLGLIFVPLNWRLAVPELQYIIDDAAPKVLFHDGNFATAVEEFAGDTAAWPVVSVAADRAGESDFDRRRAATPGIDAGAASASRPSRNDPLLIVYTSGTTGRPKGAVLTRDAVECNAVMSRHAYDMTGHDHVLNFLPMFHVGGLNIQVLPALFAGATVTLHEKFDADRTLATIAQDGITLVNMVPTIAETLIAAPAWSSETLASLKAISTGSTDVPVSLIERIHETGVPLIQIYGATETSPLAIYQRIEHAFSTVGSIGRCGLCCQARLADSGGTEVATGDAGEIWIRGRNVMLEYWNNPEATKASLVDGWFKTGDIARRDDDGNFWFADRVKHVIISGGENIYPAELHRVLNGHPAIAELAIVGEADEKWGEVPVVVAVRRDDELTEADILKAFDGVLARFKHPRRVHFVDALPRNAMGKIVLEDVKRMISNDG